MGMSGESDTTFQPATLSKQVAKDVKKTRKTSFTRTHVNFALDCLLLLVFVGLLWVAVVVQMVFPPGPLSAGWTLWGLTYTHWSDIQFGLISTLALGILLHIMLHWSWVCGVAVKLVRRGKGKSGEKKTLDDGTRTIYGVATLIVILHVVGFGIAAASLAIQAPSTF
jgi:hypothetical protein